MQTVYDEKAFLALVPHRTIKGPAEKAVNRSVASLPMGGGWTSLAPDPMKLLRHYRSLKIQSAWVLKAYQYYSRGNGNCLVFAWPKGKALPEPYDVLSFDKRDPHWEQPVPEGGTPNFMGVIDGDGSPESFLMASLFSRDVMAIGAYWHGAEWLDTRVLFENPLRSPPKSSWEWTIQARLPQRFEPCVRRRRGATEVVFHTYCQVGCQAVSQFVDRFSGEGMSFENEHCLLASALGGFMY